MQKITRIALLAILSTLFINNSLIAQQEVPQQPSGITNPFDDLWKLVEVFAGTYIQGIANSPAGPLFGLNASATDTQSPEMHAELNILNSGLDTAPHKAIISNLTTVEQNARQSNDFVTSYAAADIKNKYTALIAIANPVTANDLVKKMGRINFKSSKELNDAYKILNETVSKDPTAWAKQPYVDALKRAYTANAERSSLPNYSMQ